MSEKLSSHDVAVVKSNDDMIELIAENDMARYFAIGKKITVSERVSGGWLCHTCTSQDRYELDDHKGCSHIQRVKRYVEEHPTKAAA